MNCLKVKSGVLFTSIAPAGFRILGALEHCARIIGHDLTITSACDGIHSGPTDPHYRGMAYDVRTSDLPDPTKDALLKMLLEELCDHQETPQPVGIGFATRQWYGQIEHRNQVGEHLHIQLRNGHTYP